LLRVVAGLQADWFPSADFYPQEFLVSGSSNRMGLRLQGRPLHVPARELVSEPVSPGAIQVTRDGQCIILGVDGQTVGGYPKVAHVITADLDTLGQLRPGDRVRFARVTSAEAEAYFRQRQRELHEWLVRLRTSWSGAIE
jgi:antagonist of KipI